MDTTESDDRWQFEKSIRERELALKEREQVLKEKELDLKQAVHSSARWRNPLVLGVFAAAIAAGGNAVVSYTNGQSQRELEAEKAEQTRILEMIKTGDPDKAADNLRFLVDAGLVLNPELQKSVKNFLNNREPGSGPSLPSAAPTPQSIEPQLAPMIDNARIYLLTGNELTKPKLNDLRQELSDVGFTVIGAKFITDSGRPDIPEVRYFNAVDKQQAEKIAEFMQFRLGTTNLLTKQYNDASAKPGYIEIWLGRNQLP